MTSNGRAKIEKTFNGINIIIPSKKNWFALLFGIVWLGGWFAGILSALEEIFSSTSNSVPIFFLVFWLIGWTMVGLGLTAMLLWGYFGQERFITYRNEVFFEKIVFGEGKKDRLNASEIKNFRTEPVSYGWFNGGQAFWGLGAGKIKFDYGLKTYSFGLAVDDAEATYIVKLLKEQFNDNM